MPKANLAELGERVLDVGRATASDVVKTHNDIADLEKESITYEAVKTLAPFLAQAERVSEALHPTAAPKILGQLSEGFRKAGEYLAIAKYQYNTARNDRKRQEAIAFIDEFPKWVKQKKADGDEVKPTDPMKAHWVAMYEPVLKAKEREAFFEAMQEQLVTMKTELFMAISTAKSIAYGYKDHNMLSGVANASNFDKDKDD